MPRQKKSLQKNLRIIQDLIVCFKQPITHYHISDIVELVLSKQSPFFFMREFSNEELAQLLVTKVSELKKSKAAVEELNCKAFLNVENLTARYPTSRGQVHALEDVTFSLDEGESIGIAGESACGKSTLGLSIIR